MQELDLDGFVCNFEYSMYVCVTWMYVCLTTS